MFTQSPKEQWYHCEVTDDGGDNLGTTIESNGIVSHQRVCVYGASVTEGGVASWHPRLITSIETGTPT